MTVGNLKVVKSKHNGLVVTGGNFTVDGSGNIANVNGRAGSAGPDFTVSHPGTGQYTITLNDTTFRIVGCVPSAMSAVDDVKANVVTLLDTNPTQAITIEYVAGVAAADPATGDGISFILLYWNTRANVPQT